MKPITLVSNIDTAIANISLFNGALNRRDHPSLEKLISHVQAWYGIETEDGYLFGPSKFIGYANMTPNLYAEETGATGRLDGRVTEKKLAPWATLITTDDVRHDVVHAALADFCAGYSSFPNKRARISIFRQHGATAIVSEAEQVKAFSILISTLSDDAKRDLKKLVWP